MPHMWFAARANRLGCGHIERHVAITGLGIVSCLGSELNSVAESLRAGRSGIVCDREREQRGFRSPLTGALRGFDLEKRHIPKKALRTMNEPARYAYAAVMDAIADAGFSPDALQGERCGMVFGNDSCVGASVEAIDIARESGETHSIGSSHIFRAMNSVVTMNLAAALGVGGASWTVSAACASGAHAIGQAAMLIASGLQDVVVTGGAQELCWEGMAPFDAMDAFSTRVDAPEKASRPFDHARDGLVPSGGAACVVLEALDHARARNARTYGVVRGYGFSSDGSGRLTQPNVDGAIRAMRMALENAGVDPGDVDYVNAHGTSTRVGDLAEAKAIAEVFGTDVAVSSTKSMTGHECWMAGASEVVYTTLMSAHGFIAPNINFDRLDDDCPPIKVVNQTTAANIKVAVSNSFGFGGTNAALVLDYGGMGRWA